jgi:hypothetical protein
MTAVLVEAPTVADAFGLDPEQLQAAVLLAAGMATGKVAEHVGVNRRTLFHWRQCSGFAIAFERELATQTQLMREVVHARLLGLAEKALDVVEGALNSGGAPALAAARVVLARTDAPALLPLPTAEALQRQAEAECERAAQEQLSRMSDEELCAHLTQLRAQSAYSKQGERERFNRLSPAEQTADINARARAASERLRARRQP